MRSVLVDVQVLMRGAGVLDAQPEETVPDGGVTVVTAVIDGETRSVGLPNGSDAAARLERALRALPAFGERPYEPQALAVYASRVKDVVISDHELEPEPTTFPWPAGELVPGCSIVRGPELERVLADARRANQLTRWQSGGALHAVAFRPLLPGESSCADIAP